MKLRRRSTKPARASVVEAERRERDWERAKAELADARAALAEAEEQRDDLDPDLLDDRGAWHAERARVEQNVIEAAREVERLEALAEDRRLTALAAAEAVERVEIDRLLAQLAVVDAEERQLQARLAELAQVRLRDQAQLEAAEETLQEARFPFLGSQERYDRQAAERRLQTIADWYARSWAQGLPTDSPPPGARRYLRGAREQLDARAQAARQPSGYEKSEAARAAGIVKLDPDAPVRMHRQDAWRRDER